MLHCAAVPCTVGGMAVEKKARISVQLAASDVLVLQILSDETGESVSSIVRGLVREAIPFLKAAADMALRLRGASDDAKAAVVARAAAVLPGLEADGEVVAEGLRALLKGMEDAS